MHSYLRNWINAMMSFTNCFCLFLLIACSRCIDGGLAFVIPIRTVGTGGGIIRATNGGIGESPPTFNPEALASEFLSHPYFYNGNLAEAQAFSAGRQFAFGTKKLENLLLSFESRDQLIANMTKCSINATKVIPYSKSTPLEDRLNKRIICIEEKTVTESVEEVKLLKDRFVDLDSSKTLLRTTTLNEKNEPYKRELPLCFVLGPSGSGKTFFALKYAATFGVEHLRHTTLYIKPGKLEDVDTKNAETVVAWIKQQLETEYGAISGKLDMHVSLVLDEAGAAALNKHFEKKKELAAIIRQLEKTLASSVRLVVSGTGLTTDECSSENDAFKFRVKRWGETDLQAAITKFGFLEAERGEIIDAILNHPTLAALSTNARAAWFLLEAISKADANELPSLASWRERLSDWTAPLISTVSANYITTNGIGKIKKDKLRRRLAASVFRTIEICRRSRRPIMPVFEGLDDEMDFMASSLIELNVETKAGKLQFLEADEKSSALLTPAIVVILLYMLGMSANILSSWKAQELVTAMYEYRRVALELMEKYSVNRGDELKLLRRKWANRKNRRVNVINKEQSEDGRDTNWKEIADMDLRLHEDLDDGLGNMRLVKVMKPVPEPAGSVNFYVPRLRKGDVWINGDKAASGDVMGFFRIYQVKNCETSLDTVDIDVMTELENCGLRKDQSATDKGVIVLRGILAIWNGLLGPHSGRHSQNQSPTRTIDQYLRAFMYPMNQLNTPTVQDTMEYVKLELDKDSGHVTVQDETPFKLPELDISPEITFVFSTNALKAKMTIWGLPPKEKVHTAAHATDDLKNGNNLPSSRKSKKKLKDIAPVGNTVQTEAAEDAKADTPCDAKGPDTAKETEGPVRRTVTLTFTDLDEQGRVNFKDQNNQDLWDEFTTNFVHPDVHIRFSLG
jgi:hypothetical protein